MSGNKPTIFNLTLTNANQEYSQAFARSFNQSFMVQCRQLADIKMAFASGASGTTYITVPAGAAYTFNGLPCILTLYLQSPSAGSVAEILVWE